MLPERSDEKRGFFVEEGGPVGRPPKAGVCLGGSGGHEN